MVDMFGERQIVRRERRPGVWEWGGMGEYEDEDGEEEVKAEGRNGGKHTRHSKKMQNENHANMYKVTTLDLPLFSRHFLPPPSLPLPSSPSFFPISIPPTWHTTSTIKLTWKLHSNIRHRRGRQNQCRRLDHSRRRSRRVRIHRHLGETHRQPRSHARRGTGARSGNTGVRINRRFGNSNRQPSTINCGLRARR
jgi:hypothetical protein